MRIDVTRSGEPQRVLIADDEPSVRAVLRQLLEALSFDVVGEAVDGNEALRLFRELTPDTVVIDLKMPGLDGIEAARTMCSEASPHVVVMSAYPDEALQEAARSAGAASYVVKGGPLDELISALRRP